MTRRERILTVLAGGRPDRVPISTYELCGRNSAAVESRDPSYARLLEFIREKTDCIAMWNPRSNGTFLGSSAPVEMDTREERSGGSRTWRRVLRTPKGELRQTTTVVEGLRTVWQREHWCKSPDDVERALSVPYEPVEYDASDFARIREEVGEEGIIMASVADPLCAAAELMAFGDYTVWAMTETEHLVRTLDRLHERWMENLRRMLDCAVVDLYRICGPEYATPPYVPPALFERFVVRYVGEMVDLIHEKGSRARVHCHGKIGRVLEMMAATGADAIDPCEPPPDGDIHLAEVKARAGDRMAIFGNLELKLLEHGSEEEVAEAVRGCMAAAKEGGGYAIMPTAAPINSPLAAKTERNYIRFIETALECGQYGAGAG